MKLLARDLWVGLATTILGSCAVPQLPTGDLKLTSNTGTEVLHENPSVWVIEWDGDEIADFEREAQKGVAIVAYDGHSITLVRHCKIEGNYDFEPTITRPAVHHDINSVAEAKAKLHIKVATVDAGLSEGKRWLLDYVVAGTRELDKYEISKQELPSHCADATHFVAESIWGAYTLHSEADINENAGVGVKAIASGETGYEAKNELLKSDGQISQCSQMTTSADASECKGLIKLRLMKLTGPFS